MFLGETRTGLIGEYIASAAVLSLPGILGASLAQQDKVDMVAWDDVGFLRVQVKAGRLRHERDRRLPCYHFNYGTGVRKKKPQRGDYDIVASVAIEKRRVIFTALDALNAVTRRYSTKRFDDPDVEIDSWFEALAIVRGEK